MNVLIPSGVTHIADFIESKLLEFSNKPAFSVLGQVLSYKDIEAKSKAFAAWLQRQEGLKSGDRIAIQLPNLLQHPIAVFGALRAGLVVVNTNPMYTPTEMAHQFNDSGAKAIVILDDMLPKLDAIVNESSIKYIITTSANDLVKPDSVKTYPGCYNLIDIISQNASLELLPRLKSNLSDVCLLQYTGGTTGVSKGASLSHENILSNASQVHITLGTTLDGDNEIVVCPLPLYHIYAFTVCMISLALKGCMILLIPNPNDLDSFVEQIRPFKMTCIAGINTLFVALAAHPEFRALDFSSLKLTMAGGAALTIDAVNKWQSLTGCSVSDGYGLSEASPVVCSNPPGKEEYGTVGQPMPYTDILLLDEFDNIVPDGKAGQISVKGPQVMSGYWNMPEETAKVMTQDGYLKTGDVGIRMPSGAIKIVDRLKDVIIVSGFNVYPAEIEEVLTRLPDIVEAAVIGIPDQKTGERVCANITTSRSISDRDIINHCRQYLTAYKVPKEIRVLDELPKTAVGKILRRKLR